MNLAIIFAGGSGTRMGSDIPKQFLQLVDRPVLAHTLGIFQSHPVEIIFAGRHFPLIRHYRVFLN